MMVMSCLSVRLFVCVSVVLLFVCSFICLSFVLLFVCLFICLSVVFLFVCLFICLFVVLLFVCLFICFLLSFCLLFVYLFVCLLSVCLSVCLFVCCLKCVLVGYWLPGQTVLVATPAMSCWASQPVHDILMVVVACCISHSGHTSLFYVCLLCRCSCKGSLKRWSVCGSH